MNGSTLARFGIGALIAACCAAPGVASADVPTLNPTGALTFSWQGDPARGCQAAGVCAVSGSLVVIPEDQSGSAESPRSRDIRIDDAGAVVRVTDPGSTDAQPHVCTQLAPVIMELTVARRHSGGLHAVADTFSAPTSGDCAGPSALSLSNIQLPARQLPGRTEAYDLSGALGFGSGPYAVTVRSTIRARRPSEPAAEDLGLSSSSSSGSSGPVPGLQPFKALVEHVSIDYRITTNSGAVTTAFDGRPDPFCVPLDACGVTGALTDTISGTSTKLEFDAQHVVVRRASRRKALADLRAGRLTLSDTGETVSDVLSANIAWSAGTACTDGLRRFNALAVDATPDKHLKRMLFSLVGNSTEDPFRTACPGPGIDDVLGSSDALARGALPVRDLGRSSLRVVVSGHGRFVTGTYAGARNGGITLGLRLVRVRAATELETVFPGEP